MKKIAITLLLILSSTLAPQAICRASCNTCGGGGACHVCDGSGKSAGGGTCIICNGGKKCYVCSGSGNF